MSAFDVVAYQGVVDGRRVTVFARPGAVAEDDLRIAAEADVDDADRARAVLLRAVLRAGHVRGTVDPLLDPMDVMQVYLRADDGDDLFACVLVPRAHVARMLGEAPVVIEGFSLEVAQGDLLTADGIRAAMEAWAQRNFPDVAVPTFEIEPWLPAPEQRNDGFRAPGPKTLAFVAPASVDPSTITVDPPLGRAA